MSSSPGTKLALSDTCPTRSGCSVSAPLSSIATFTPWPVSPSAHTFCAPIWAVESARSAFTLPSSHTLATPPAKDGFADRAAAPETPVSEDQNSGACLWFCARAAPWMLSRRRTSVVLAIFVRVRALAAAPE
ncbi:hypothetical protein ACFQ51_15195 [Streptomyces kaempferi]